MLKKMMIVLSITGIFGLLVAQKSGFSFGISVPGPETVVKDVGKTATVSKLNKYLAGQNCQCNVTTGKVSGCDLKAIGAKVNGEKEALKIALGRYIYFYSKAKTQACSYNARDQLKSYGYSYWTYYAPYDSSMGKKVEMWVE